MVLRHAVLLCAAAATEAQAPLYTGRVSAYDAPRVAPYGSHVAYSIPSAPHVTYSTHYYRPRSQDCTVGDWSDWGLCSASCGDGVKYRSRSVTSYPSYGGKPCPSTHAHTNCNDNPCPIHCQYEWGDWSLCTLSCGKGSKMRDIQVQIKAAYGGNPCPSAQHAACNVQDCPDDCTYSDWSHWGDCDKACGHGKQYRERTIYNDPGYGGKGCPATEDAKPCMLKYCPNDCEYEWGDWAACTQTCGGGSTEKRAKVTAPASHGGKACPPDEHATCNTDYCPVDCYVQNYGAWTACTSTCGPGTQYRTRDVAKKPLYGGKACPPVKEDRGCYLKECPIDCAYEWGDWSDCTKTCGGGTQYRKADPSVAAQYGGQSCPPDETKSCNSYVCPVDCVVGDFEGWSKCDHACGMGVQSRERLVKVKAAFGGKQCPHLYEERDCFNGPCAYDCTYEWGGWSDCDKSCGGGYKYRNVNVTHAKVDGVERAAKNCPNDEKQYCNSDYCPLDCYMGDWGDWSDCSATCGDGYSERTRQVEKKPDYGGKKCGSTYQKKNCFDTYCPVDCDYTWGDWSDCSYTCGGGYQTRQPKVATKGKYGGDKCPGEDKRDCGKDPCPLAYAKEALTYAHFPDYATAPNAMYEGASETSKHAPRYADYTGTASIKAYVPEQHTATYAPTPMPIYETICLNDCAHARDGECDDGGSKSVYSHCKLGHDCADCGERLKLLDEMEATALRAQLPVSAFKREHNKAGDYFLAPKLFDVTDQDLSHEGYKALPAVPVATDDDAAYEKAPAKKAYVATPDVKEGYEGVEGEDEKPGFIVPPSPKEEVYTRAPKDVEEEGKDEGAAQEPEEGEDEGVTQEPESGVQDEGVQGDSESGEEEYSEGGEEEGTDKITGMHDGDYTTRQEALASFEKQEGQSHTHHHHHDRHHKHKSAAVAEQALAADGSLHSTDGKTAMNAASVRLGSGSHSTAATPAPHNDGGSSLTKVAAVVVAVAVMALVGVVAVVLRRKVTSSASLTPASNLAPSSFVPQIENL